MTWLSNVKIKIENTFSPPQKKNIFKRKEESNRFQVFGNWIRIEIFQQSNFWKFIHQRDRIFEFLIFFYQIFGVIKALNRCLIKAGEKSLRNLSLLQLLKSTIQLSIRIRKNFELLFKSEAWMRMEIVLFSFLRILRC